MDRDPDKMQTRRQTVEHPFTHCGSPARWGQCRARVSLGKEEVVR
jgi:hypothetical protein